MGFTNLLLLGSLFEFIILLLHCVGLFCTFGSFGGRRESIAIVTAVCVCVCVCVRVCVACVCAWVCVCMRAMP